MARSRESIIAVAREAERLVECEPLLLAERSASIINNAIDGRNVHRTHDASTTPIGAFSSPTRMDHVQTSTGNSPSKRARGRPRNAKVGQDTGNVQVPGAQKTGRLRLPAKSLNQRSAKSIIRATGKDVFELPEDLIPNQHDGGFPREALHKQTVHQRWTPGTEADPDPSIVISTGNDTIESQEPTNGHISGIKIPVRRGRPKGTKKKSTSVQTQSINMPITSPVTRSLRSRTTLAKQPLEQVRERGITEFAVDDEASLANHNGFAKERSGSEAHRSGRNDTLHLKASDRSSIISPTLESEFQKSDDSESQFSDQEANERKDAQGLGSTAQLATGDFVQASSGRGGEVQNFDLVSLELFGHQARWKEVLNAARSIGTVKKGQTKRRHKIPLETQTIQDFVHGVREASECYQGLVGSDHPGNGEDNIIESQLLDHLDSLGTEVERLEEDHAGNQKGLMIQDVYAHALPEIVFLLNQAFTARSALYSAPGETQYMKEVICLLELAIELCKKATSWKAAPDTELPIISQTKKVIFPSLRIICTAFEAELGARIGEKKRVREEAIRADGYQAREARRKEQEEKCRRERERRQHQGAIDAMRILGSLGLRPFSQPSQQAIAQDHWNDEQDEELLRQLEEWQTLPGM